MNNAWLRNGKIALILSVCYVVGMFAAYQTTEAFRRFRRADASAQVVEPGVASATVSE